MNHHIPIELETYEKLEAIAKKQKLTVDQYVSKIIKEEMKHPPRLQSNVGTKEWIEYETITLKVPKRIMDFLRSMPEGYPPDLIGYLEWRIVDCIRADLESTNGMEIIDWLGLAPVFRTVLRDKRFKQLE